MNITRPVEPNSPSAMRNDPWIRSVGRIRWLLLPAVVAAGGALLAFAFLRESPLFWRSAGGYPPWLRDLVRIGFVPLATGVYGLLLLASGLFIGRPPRSLRAWWMESAFLALAWALAAFALVVVIANNLANLVDGRPLHFHP